MRKKKVDKFLLVITITLVLLGFLIFTSASLGLLAREGGKISGIAIRQTISLALGLILMIITIKIPFRVWNKYAFYIFLLSIFATLLVFIPGLGLSHGGAQRWIELGPLTLQPAELLKLGAIVFFASWLAGVKQKVRQIKYGPLALLGILAVVGAILITQPDVGTFIVISITLAAMFIVAGGRWLHILALAVIGSGGLLALGITVPYIQTRLLTFLNPSADPLGAGYQIQQSLIAIGSGRIFGRGFGQSVQKFNFLPEPVGDSIFAVFAEEWGFVGALVLLTIFMMFAFRAFKIASKSPTIFSGLLVTGITVAIIGQLLINVASMLGIFPLTGMPLLFVSQGGSALLVALAMVGIVLNISKEQKA